MSPSSSRRFSAQAGQAVPEGADGAPGRARSPQRHRHRAPRRERNGRARGGRRGRRSSRLGRRAGRGTRPGSRPQLAAICRREAVLESTLMPSCRPPSVLLRPRLADAGVDAVAAQALSLPASPFRSPGWLRGGHAQTIWPYLLPRIATRYRRERVDTPDGDFWDFDWVDPADSSPESPLLILLHGLEGGSDSHYARALMAAVAAQGWRGVVPHFRGCGGEPNRRPRAYHSGDHEEFAAMLAAIRERVPARIRAVRRGRVGRRLGAAQLARPPRPCRQCGTARGRGHIDAAGPDRCRLCDRPRRESHLCAALPADAEAEEHRHGAPLPRPARREAGSGARGRCTRSTTRSPRRCTGSPARPTTGGARRRSPGSRTSRCRRWC